MNETKKVPLVTAAIAILLVAVLALGVAMLITNHINDPGGDTAFQIEGIWETPDLTYNDAHMIFTFEGDIFTSVTESVIFDANPEIIETITEYYQEHTGAIVTASDLGNGDFMLTIATDGTFALYGDTIRLLSGEGMLQELPFSIGDAQILINYVPFVKRGQ